MGVVFELAKRIIIGFILGTATLYIYAKTLRSEVFCDNVAPPNITFAYPELTKIGRDEYFSIAINVNGSSFPHHRLYYAIVYIPAIDYIGIVKNFGSSIYRHLFASRSRINSWHTIDTLEYAFHASTIFQFDAENKSLRGEKISYELHELSNPILYYIPLCGRTHFEVESTIPKSYLLPGESS